MLLGRAGSVSKEIIRSFSGGVGMDFGVGDLKEEVFFEEGCGGWVG